jgi:hypothetical protein
MPAPFKDLAKDAYITFDNLLRARHYYSQTDAAAEGAVTFAVATALMLKTKEEPYEALRLAGAAAYYISYDKGVGHRGPMTSSQIAVGLLVAAAGSFKKVDVTESPRLVAFAAHYLAKVAQNPDQAADLIQIRDAANGQCLKRGLPTIS